MRCRDRSENRQGPCVLGYVPPGHEHDTNDCVLIGITAYPRWECGLHHKDRRRARSTGLVDVAAKACRTTSVRRSAASFVPGERGFDGAKKIDGIKRHILVDTAGRLLAVHVTAANVQDRAAFADLIGKNPCPSVAHVWADKEYTGQATATAASSAGIELEIVSGPKPAGGFVVQPRRWVVERTNGWINRHRRLVRQYEATLAAHEAFVTISQIRLLLRRLDNRR